MTRLQSIAEDLRSVDDSTRVELLLDFADSLPPLPGVFHPIRDSGIGMIHECQSPVFLMVTIESGLIRIFADVPRETPTARSFVALLIESFDQQVPDVVLSAPSDILRAFGLTHLLGMQRSRGLTAVYQHVKREVARLSKPEF